MRACECFYVCECVRECMGVGVRACVCTYVRWLVCFMYVLYCTAQSYTRYKPR